MHGGRSAVGCGQCRFRHRGGSRPVHVSHGGDDNGIMGGLTLMAACKARAISLSCSSLGLLPRISGSQNWPTAPFMWPIFPWAGAGALTHCEGSRPTPQTM